MNTYDEINNLKNSIEEQNCLIERILYNNKIYLDKLEDILHGNEVENNREVLVGDYIAYYDCSADNLLIAKIVKNEDFTYQLFYPLFNECSHCCYDSIEELIYDYSDYEDFEIIYTGEYSNNIPKKTSSYILIKDNEFEDELLHLELLENNGFYLYDKDTDDILARKNTYDELIFYVMKNFQLIIPLRNF